jgi:hypothetical protein
MTEIPKRKCAKVGFEEKSEAVAHARYVRVQQIYRSHHVKSYKSNRKLRPYLCKLCGLFHLTTQKPRKGRCRAKPRKKS